MLIIACHHIITQLWVLKIGSVLLAATKAYIRDTITSICQFSSADSGWGIRSESIVKIEPLESLSSGRCIPYYMLWNTPVSYKVSMLIVLITTIITATSLWLITLLWTDDTDNCLHYYYDYCNYVLLAYDGLITLIFSNITCIYFITYDFVIFSLFFTYMIITY